MHISITKAKKTDASQVCQLIRHSITHICGPDYAEIDGFIENWLVNKTVPNVQNWIKSKESIFLIAKNKESIAGIANMNHQGEILLFYISPHHINKGVGRSLIKALEFSARELGLTEIHANSTITAHGFYARQGFRKSGQAIRHGDYETEYPMAKTLHN